MEIKLIEANAFLQRLQKKKSGPANAKFTDGFNDAIMRVRSMVHSEPAVELECLTIVKELRKDKEMLQALVDSLKVENKELSNAVKRAQRQAKEGESHRKNTAMAAKVVRDKLTQLQMRNKEIKESYGDVISSLEQYLATARKNKDSQVSIPGYLVKMYIDEWKLQCGGDD